MHITFDPHKRHLTLMRRGLDMADAEEVFESEILSLADDRKDYGEERFISVGYLNGRMVVMVWTPRGENRRIISLRKANAREQRLIEE